MTGNTVRTDPYEYRVRERFSNTRGKDDYQKMFKGDTLFNNHVSFIIDDFRQFSLGTSNALKGKGMYEH